MATSNPRKPIVVSMDNKRIELIPYEDYISALHSPLNHPSITVISEVLVKMHGTSIGGLTYTQDYPERGQITGRQFISGRRVDNLVQGPVEIAAGSWQLGYVHDNHFKDYGTYPAYVYVIPQSSINNNQLAIDYFRTGRLRNGTMEYMYEGTCYFKAPTPTEPLRLYSSTQNSGFGVETTTNYPSTHNPSPSDVVATKSYIVPRRLKPGEQPQNIITTNSTYVTGDDYISAIRTSGLFG